MRNYVLVMLSIFLVLSGCATNPAITNSTTYFDVVEVNGVSSADLFVKINLWFVDAFKSAKSVIEFSDKDAGVIKGKYLFEGFGGQWASPYDCESTLTIETKDGRYRISFAQPYIYYYSMDRSKRGKVTPVHSEEFAAQIIEEWKKLADNLKLSLSTQSSDW